VLADQPDGPPSGGGQGVLAASLDHIARGIGALPDGGSVYMQPVSPVAGAPDSLHGGLRLGGTALGFSAIRIIARESNKKRCIDSVLPASCLPDLIKRLDPHCADRLMSLAGGVTANRGPLVLGGGKTLAFTRPRVMGVLNVTPDSFSDGGDYIDTAAAVTHARAMLAEGADIIDVGGESTRPGADPVWEGDEEARVRPVLDALAGEDGGAILSIDTRRASVMRSALAAGVHILNDVSALSHDPESMAVAVASDTPVILMHAQGNPATMQEDPTYSDVVLDVFDYLEGRLQACIDAGIAADRIILDPGIGFGKRVVADNLALLNAVAIFHTLGRPLLIGASRKRFIGAVAGVEDPKARMPGSLAVAVQSAMHGCQIIRAHDVAETRQALSLAQAYLDTGAMDAASWTG